MEKCNNSRAGETAADRKRQRFPRIDKSFCLHRAAEGIYCMWKLSNIPPAWAAALRSGSFFCFKLEFVIFCFSLTQIVHAAMRQISTILAAAGVGLRRGTFSLAKKYPKRHRNPVGFGLPVLGAGSWVASEGERYRQLFLPPRSFLSDFACRPSPPYIAKSVCRFRSLRLAKLYGGEFQHQYKALRRKGRNRFHNRRSG